MGGPGSYAQPLLRPVVFFAAFSCLFFIAEGFDATNEQVKGLPVEVRRTIAKSITDTKTCVSHGRDGKCIQPGSTRSLGDAVKFDATQNAKMSYLYEPPAEFISGCVDSRGGSWNRIAGEHPHTHTFPCFTIC